MAKRQQPERQLQSVVSQYLGMALPHDSFFSSLPGGNGRVTTTPGYRSGLLDMLILCRGFPPILMELKWGRGRLSSQQRQVIEEAMAAGARCFVVYGLHEVEINLRSLGIPLRASVSERRAA